MPDSWTTIRARIAAIKRHHPDRDVTDLLRDLRIAWAAEQIARLRTVIATGGSR